jgi:hypothetical protein
MPEAVLHYSKAKDTRTDHDLEHPHKDDLLASLMTDAEWPIDNNIPHHQTDRDVAYDVVTDLMNMPDGDDEEIAIREGIVDATDKRDYNIWIKNAKYLRDREVDTMQYDSVTEIAWIPTKPNLVARTPDGLLSGEYTCMVKRVDGTIMEMKDVTNEWVEAHFKPIVLQKVQALAYEKLEMIVTEAGVAENLRTGFFKLEASGKNMVNVEGYGVGVKLDDDVINHIKYVRSSTVLSGPIFKVNKKGKQVLDRKGNRIRVTRVETIRPA